MHVDYDLTIEELPRDCVDECSAPGPADNAVDYWRVHLGFTVNRERAIRCLQGYGAWSAEELSASSNDELAARVLWLACGSFNEYATEAKCAGFDPWTDERPEDFDPNCGSDLFCLE